ncbi:hypothetical protein JB92DRAFT_3128292 [Gautieria morchelliformis]|nr:hypothetical protein JB92DRAFT_3128292 [Gautieria morchelliformis]
MLRDGEEIERKTLSKASYHPLSSAFILLRQQISAHMAAQILIYGRPLRMSDKYIEVVPPHISGPFQSPSWAPCLTSPRSAQPTSGLPGSARSLPQSPASYRASFPEGIPTGVGIELSLMDRFFFGSGHPTLPRRHSQLRHHLRPAGIIQNPAKALSMLALKLPASSTFFLTYIILQGISVTAGRFLNIVSLIIYYVKLTLLGSTPRSIYSICYTLRDVAWGTLGSDVTLLVVIGCRSPLLFVPLPPAPSCPQHLDTPLSLPS